MAYPRGRIRGRLAPSELREGSVPCATVFSLNTFRLQSALHGSKRKVEVASARRKLPDDDSTLPRLLTAVYTPLLRCATASDACQLACGLRTKQTGSCCQVPRFAFLGIASDAWILSEPLRTESQDTREVVYPRSLQASQVASAFTSKPIFFSRPRNDG